MLWYLLVGDHFLGVASLGLLLLALLASEIAQGRAVRRLTMAHYTQRSNRSGQQDHPHVSTTGIPAETHTHPLVLATSTGAIQEWYVEREGRRSYVRTGLHSGNRGSKPMLRKRTVLLMIGENTSSAEVQVPRESLVLSHYCLSPLTSLKFRALAVGNSCVLIL